MSDNDTPMEHLARYMAAFRWPARPWSKLSNSCREAARSQAHAALRGLAVPVEKARSPHVSPFYKEPAK